MQTAECIVWVTMKVWSRNLIEHTGGLFKSSLMHAHPQSWKLNAASGANPWLEAFDSLQCSTAQVLQLMMDWGKQCETRSDSKDQYQTGFPDNNPRRINASLSLALLEVHLTQSVNVT